MFTTIIIGASVTVAAALVTGSRVIGWRRVAKHATLVDVGFTIIMAMLLFGTITGMLVAITAGLFMALVLSSMRMLASALDKRNSKAAPFGEFNTDGTWIYNQAPYV